MALQTLASVVTRLAVASVVAFAIAWVPARNWVGEPTATVFAYALESLFLLLPAAAGIALASLGRPRRVEALTTLAVVTLGMAALDFAPPSQVDVLPPSKHLLKDSGEMVMSNRIGRWNEAGAFPVLASYLSGQIPEANRTARTYRGGSPRKRVAHAIFRSIYLLLPIAVIGFVYGSIRWMERSMLFTRRSAERIAEFMLGWVLGPVIVGLAQTLSDGALSEALFGGASLAAITYPILALVALSVPLWLIPDPIGEA